MMQPLFEVELDGGCFQFCARYRILDLRSLVLFYFVLLIQKSLSHPDIVQAVGLFISVRDTGFEPVAYPTSRGRSTN